MAENNQLFGRPWKDHGTYKTHTDAVAAKDGLQSDSVQVKIRRTPENTFRVRFRSSVVEDVKTKSDKPNTPAKTRSARRKEKAARHKARQEKE